VKSACRFDEASKKLCNAFTCPRQFRMGCIELHEFCKLKFNKNLCGRDGRTICGPQCVLKSTDALSACGKLLVCHCNSLGGAT